MLEFNNCCFCIPLRTGCLILGYLHLVASIALTVIFGIGLAAVATTSRDVEINQDAANIIIASTVILLLLVIVLLTFSILLVVGIHKEKKNYVKAYLVYYFMFTVLYAILYIVTVATLPFDLGYFLGTLAEIMLGVYFMLVIRSHWLTMGENSGNNFNTASTTMLEFNNCCFCIPLRTGCLILGYLHLVASIALTVICGIGLAAVATAIRDVEINQDAANIIIASTVILLLLVIVLLTFSILLVVGIHKEKKNYVKAYLVYYIIFTVLYAILYIVQVATSPFNLGYFLCTLAEIMLGVYFMLVIRSHWLTMGENSGNNFNTAYSARRSES